MSSFNVKMAIAAVIGMTCGFGLGMMFDNILLSTAVAFVTSFIVTFVTGEWLLGRRDL